MFWNDTVTKSCVISLSMTCWEKITLRFTLTSFKTNTNSLAPQNLQYYNYKNSMNFKPGIYDTINETVIAYLNHQIDLGVSITDINVVFAWLISSLPSSDSDQFCLIIATREISIFAYIVYAAAVWISCSWNKLLEAREWCDLSFAFVCIFI